MYMINQRTVFQDGFTIGAHNLPVPASGYRLTMTVNGVETEIAPGEYHGEVVLEPTEAYHRIGAFQMAGADDYEYRAGLFVDENGIQPARSALSAISGGSVTAEAAENISITSTSPDFNGIILSGPIHYEIRNSHFSFPSHNDGRVGCDFTGYGAVIYVLNGAEVVLDHCEFETEGVVRPCVYVDERANVIMKHCSYQVEGGKLFAEYQNCAETDNMVAAPWVLGIKGNCRGVNVMGFNSSLTLVDSHCAAKSWGVVSTDIGTNQQLTVIDSTLTMPLREEDRSNPFLRRFGPGYGTYATGDYANCQEFFYGAHFEVGTYGTIFTLGTATYASSKGEIVVERPERYPGKELLRVQGKGNPTVIDSDGFGFMTHGGAEIHVTDGTQVNSDRSTFLIRSSDVSIEVSDGAELKPGNGILLQMADNDDELVGVNPATRCVFNTEYSEPMGWPSENGSVTGQSSGEQVTFCASHVELKGSLYNGTGYYGKPAHDLQVTLEDGAHLTGAISATETHHIDEFGKQKASFTSDEYYYIGSVGNRPYFSGHNTVAVTLKGDAQWTVTGDSHVSQLMLTGSSRLEAAPDRQLSVSVDGIPVEPVRDRLYQGHILIQAIPIP